MSEIDLIDPSYHAFAPAVLKEYQRLIPVHKGWTIKRLSSDGKPRLCLFFFDGSVQRLIRDTAALTPVFESCTTLSTEERSSIQAVCEKLDKVFATCPTKTAPISSQVLSSAPPKRQQSVSQKPRKRAKRATADQETIDAESTILLLPEVTSSAASEPKSYLQPKPPTKPGSKANPKVDCTKSKPTAGSNATKANLNAKPNPKLSSNLTSEVVSDLKSVCSQTRKRAVPIQKKISDQNGPIAALHRASTISKKTGTSNVESSSNVKQVSDPNLQTRGLDVDSGSQHTHVLVEDQREIEEVSECKATELPQRLCKRKSKRKMMSTSGVPLSGVVEIYTGTYKHFEGLRNGAKGVHKSIKANSSRGSIVPSAKVLEDFAKRDEDTQGLQPLQAIVIAQYEQRSVELVRLLHMGRNLLFYGYGDKTPVVKGLISKHLSGEDVIEVDDRSDDGPRSLLAFLIRNYLPSSSFPSHNLIQLSRLVSYGLTQAMGTRTDRPLCYSSSHVQRCATRQPTQAHSLLVSARQDRYQKNPKIFIALHGLDSGPWACAEAQTCLSILASCTALRFIASVEDPSILHAWDTRMLVSFRWAGVLAPTYEPLPSSYLVKSGQEKNWSEGGGLEHVLKSLTTRHAELVSVLATLTLAQPDGQVGIPLATLMAACRRKMLAQHQIELQQFLTELMDHKLVATVRGSDGVERVRMIVDEATLHKLRDFKR